MLADRLAASSAQGLDTVTDQLLRAIRQPSPSPGQPHPSAGPVASAPVQDRSAQRRALTDYASDLHKRHVAQLIAGKGPVAILDAGALVVHVVPFGAIDGKPSDAFEEVARSPHKFPPMSPRGQDSRISYDGLLVGSNAKGMTEPQRAYVSVSRSGVIEGVESSLARGPKHNFLALPALQASIIKYSHVYIRTLGGFSISAPYAVCVSLINVRDMNLLQDFIPQGAILEDLQCGVLDRSEFEFGHAIVEAMPNGYNETAKALRPILAHLANAAGLHSSPYFDAAGDYELFDKL
jgi:hypothetical protein